MVSLAQTGTGKTAAFGFPMLQKIDVNSRTTQGLILSPTRELCLQITNEMISYGKYMPGLNVTAIYGGASITDQARQIKRGSQIIVATPGRMKDMIGRGLIDISKIEYCVLDEADEMLNMGFFEDIPRYFLILLKIKVHGFLVQLCRKKFRLLLRSLCILQWKLPLEQKILVLKMYRTNIFW